MRQPTAFPLPVESIELTHPTGLVSGLNAKQLIIQRNHIACAILVWNYLKKLAYLTQKKVYQLKAGLLSSYLTKELKFPSIKMELV